MVIVYAGIMPSTSQCPNRCAIATAAISVTSPNREASRAPNSFRNGVPLTVRNRVEFTVRERQLHDVCQPPPDGTPGAGRSSLIQHRLMQVRGNDADNLGQLRPARPPYRRQSQAHRYRHATLAGLSNPPRWARKSAEPEPSHT